MEARYPEAEGVREAERHSGDRYRGRRDWDTEDDTAHRGPSHRGSAHRGAMRDRSVGQIVGDLASEVAHLARLEAELAAREVADKAKRGAKGGGMFAVAGAFAFYGGAAFALAAGFALALVWPAWLAAIVVGAVLFALAGVEALVGRSMLRRALPPVPDEAMERAREDAMAMRGRMDR